MAGVDWPNRDAVVKSVGVRWLLAADKELMEGRDCIGGLGGGAPAEEPMEGIRPGRGGMAAEEAVDEADG
jgi:hypothetical protein